MNLAEQNPACALPMNSEMIGEQVLFKEWRSVPPFVIEMVTLATDAPKVSAHIRTCGTEKYICVQVDIYFYLIGSC